MNQHQVEDIITNDRLFYRIDAVPIIDFINTQPLITEVFRFKKDLNLDLNFLIKTKKVSKDFKKSLDKLNTIAEGMALYKEIRNLKPHALFFQAQVNAKPYSYEKKDVYIFGETFGTPGEYGHDSFIEKNTDKKQDNLYKLVLFINDDFTGGETTFPKKNIDIKPEGLKVLFHPSNKDYIYGIRPIRNGVRMTINCYYESLKNN